MGCDIVVLKCLTILHIILRRLSWLQSASPAAVLGVVVNEHVVRYCKDVAIYAHSAGQDHLRETQKKKHECVLDSDCTL